MSWSPDSIRLQIDRACQQITNQELQKQEPYAFVFNFLKSNNLLVV
jgi:hypothetical protein